MFDERKMRDFAEALAAQCELPEGCRFVVIVADAELKQFGMGSNVDERETMNILVTAAQSIAAKALHKASGKVKG